MTEEPTRHVPDPPLLWWGVIAVELFDDEGRDLVTEYRGYVVGAMTESEAYVRLAEYATSYSGGFHATITDGPWPTAEQAILVRSTRDGIDDLDERSRRAMPES